MSEQELELQLQANEQEIDKRFPLDFVPAPGAKQEPGKKRKWRKGWSK